MTTAWTRGIAIGLLMWPIGCEVSVNDDFDEVGGNAGRTSFGGSSGNAGQGGTGGTIAGSGGTAGLATNGGTGGVLLVPAPTCAPEDVDQNDPCAQCLKQNCCSEWLECNDRTCFEEWNDVAECVIDSDSPGEDEYGMCLSESSEAGDGFVQANTQSLLNCATELADDAGLETRCSSECLGTDIFFE